MQRKLTILALLGLLLLAGIYYWSFFGKPFIAQEREITRGTCLGDNEKIDYKIEKNLEGGGTVKIFISDKKTGQELFGFQVKISDPDHYHPIELHKCGAYAIRTFGYDYNKKIPLDEYRRELWTYNYQGVGRKVISDSARLSTENTLGDFRIDPNESYLVLERGYFGSPDYATIIKNLKTLKDVFMLPMSEIEKKNPDVVGDMQFENWSRDGRYFWIDTSYGANTLGFIRIDSQDWDVDLFTAPKDVLGGDALNLENGYITVHPGNVWFGIKQITDEEKAKRRVQGIGTELFIHNLITGERKFVTKTDEPLWYFKPKWLSDVELQYELPNGEKKIYNIYQ